MNTLGYYLCDGHVFTSKIRACIYATAHKKPIKWIFHQDVYSTYNWWSEPEESLDDLYDKRARELREQYDYLILSYSGGADSHNIAQSFLRQGLFIDEIVTNHISAATKTSTILNPNATSSSNFSAEHELQTIPRLRELQSQMPRTKFTILDVSEPVIQGIKKNGDESWVEERTDHLTVGQAFRYNYFHFSNVKKQFDNGKKVAIIVGIDKPKIKINDNKVFVFFSDTTSNITPIDNFKGYYDNVNIELFYWSKTTAKLVCKQAHVIKNWIQSNPRAKAIWMSDDYKTMRLVQEKLLRNVIYTTWDASWFQADKSSFWWHSEFDDWFHNNDNFKTERVIWQKGLDHLATAAGDYVTKDYLGRPDNLQAFTQFYYIGNLK